MRLTLITPTRRRWHWLRLQARAIAGQLSPDDRWIIAVDSDRPDKNVVGEITRMIPSDQLIWLHCAYARPEPPVACVNRLRNAATAMAPPRHDIVEIDDHDLLAPYALAEIRTALAAGYDYVFGWYHQQAVVEKETEGEREGETEGQGSVRPKITPSLLPSISPPSSLGTIARLDSTLSDAGSQLEEWPDVQHRYERGAFERREIDAIGVRAFKRWLWTKLGGWATNIWPGGDYHFALRAESIGAKIVCLEQALCTVTIEPESISASNRQGRRVGSG